MGGFRGKIKGEGPLKTRIFAIFEIRKSAENPENSKIGGKKCSHVPMFPEIFPKLPRIRGVGVVPCNHATIAGMAGMAGIGRNGRFSGENQRTGAFENANFRHFSYKEIHSKSGNLNNHGNKGTREQGDHGITESREQGDHGMSSLKPDLRCATVSIRRCSIQSQDAR